MKPPAPQLTTIQDIAGLTIHANPADLHHDLITYLDYVGERSIKRSARDNWLPKTNLRELARRITDPTAAADIKESGQSIWIAFVEFLAFNMKLAAFEMDNRFVADFLIPGQGGYSDNYVMVVEQNLREFLKQPAIRQEAEIREALINLPLTAYNEFFDPSPARLLDRFYDYGREFSSAAIADFPGARRLLLALLENLPSGTWFSVDSLVAYLKAHHRYFLLPERIRSDKRERPMPRYHGLREYKLLERWTEIEIQEADADGFERGEGRFVERFLESLPLLLRYIELAYDLPVNSDKPKPGSIRPQCGVLKAFRVNDRFLHLMHGKTPPARVTVQPNFEILIVAEVYPADLLADLNPLCDMVSQSSAQAGPSVLTLRLKKERVASQVAAHPELDVIALLRKISNQDLAQNVVTELREWTQHSDVFTLYEGCGLVESIEPLNPNVLKNLVIAEISPRIQVIRKPDEVLRALANQNTQSKQIVIQHAHQDHELSILPDEIRHTIFATTSRPLSTQPKVQPATIKREERVILRLSGQPQAFEALRSALVDLHVPIETVNQEQTILYAKEYDSLLEKALASIADRFQVKVQ